MCLQSYVNKSEEQISLFNKVGLPNMKDFMPGYTT